MSASTCVFETYELLEWILLHLPLRELLLAERVCKTWQKLIHKFEKISTVLFRRPAHSNVQLLMPGMVLPGQSSLPSKKPVPPSFLNPFLSDFVDSTKRFVQLDHALIDPNRTPIRSLAFNHQTASWQKMLLLQPQPKSMSFICKKAQHDCCFDDCSFTMHTQSHGTGGYIIMKQICKYLKQHFQDCPTCPTLENLFGDEEPVDPTWDMQSYARSLILPLSMTGCDVLKRVEGENGS